ncbi:hypothetical protein SUGI_0318680 [Cryptomeria japonica]|nr:hypothetical protein SUGI_0318680 [Cryptomeria japonica]
MQSDARWKQIQHESNHSSSVYYSLLLGAKHLDVLELIIDIAGQKAQRNLFAVQNIEVSTFLDIFVGISIPRSLFHPKAASSALEDFAIAKYYGVADSDDRLEVVELGNDAKKGITKLFSILKLVFDLAVQGCDMSG